MALAAKAFSDLITFTRASTAGYYGSDGLYKTAASGVARTGAYADYNPATLAIRGFLVEESRTNLLLRSDDWSASSTWGLVNVTQTPAQAIGIDGTMSMTKLAVTANGATLAYQTFVATSTTMVFSIYVKQGSGANEANEFAWYNSTTSTAIVTLTINYSTGNISHSLGSGATAENVGGGIWRISVPVSSGIAVGNSVNVYSCFTGGIKAPGPFAYASKAQAEVGTFATSYIPTTTAQVTRAADVSSVNTLSPWFNQAAGTMYAEIATANGDYPHTFAFQNGDLTSECHMAYVAKSGTGRTALYDAYSGGVAQASLVTPVSSTLLKFAIAFSANDFAVVHSGGAVSTDTSGTVPAVTKLWVGNRGGAQYWLNGHLRVLRYYPRRLTNAELQALTA